MKTLMKVWPLRLGLNGCDALGNELILTPGLAGWMREDEARAADAAGEVQIMAGLRPKDLKQPTAVEPRASVAKKRTYRRRDMHAENSADK